MKIQEKEVEEWMKEKILQIEKKKSFCTVILPQMHRAACSLELLGTIKMKQ